jgi:hypothetical protein
VDGPSAGPCGGSTIRWRVGSGMLGMGRTIGRPIRHQTRQWDVVDLDVPDADGGVAAIREDGVIGPPMIGSGRWSCGRGDGPGPSRSGAVAISRVRRVVEQTHSRPVVHLADAQRK